MRKPRLKNRIFQPVWTLTMMSLSFGVAPSGSPSSIGISMTSCFPESPIFWWCSSSQRESERAAATSRRWKWSDWEFTPLLYSLLPCFWGMEKWRVSCKFPNLNVNFLYKMFMQKLIFVPCFHFFEIKHLVLIFRSNSGWFLPINKHLASIVPISLVRTYIRN